MPPANLVPPLNQSEDEAWRSDYIPSNQTRREMQNLRESYAERMKAIDDVAASLRAGLQDIENQREELEGRIVKLDAATSPWKALPPETLSLIFEHVQEGKKIHLSAVHADKNDRVHKTTYPERVCSRWRKIALNTPSLWSRIEIDYAELVVEEHWDELTDHAIEVVSRGARELTIQFSSVHVDCAREYIKEYIARCSSQLKCFEVGHYESDAAFVSSIASLLPSLPKLSHFKDTLGNEDQDDPEPLPFSVSGKYTLNFMGWCADASAATTSGPLDKLRTFQVGGTNSNVFLTPPEFFHILQLCPNLFGFEAGLRNEDVATLSVEVPEAQLVHRKIERINLKFKGKWPERVTNVMEKLVLPALTQLYMTAGGPNIAEIAAADILSFLDRSQCTLLHFNVFDHAFPAGDLQVLLPRLSALEGLSMNPTIMTPALFDKIATGELLPKVKDLRGHIVGNQATITALKNVADSRWNNKNGSNVHTMFYEYWKLPDWTPPPFPSAWEEEHRKAKRWVYISPLPWSLDDF